MPHASSGRPARTPPSAASSSRATTIARQRAASARARSIPGSSTGTSGRPRAASGAGTPSSAATVVASSQTLRGSRLCAPGTAPLPHTMKGTGRSPQSRWPWPPIPRPWPWSAIRITVASSSLPRSSRNARKSPTWRSLSATWSRYSGLRTPRTCPSWSAASSCRTSRSGSSSSTTRRPSAQSEWSIRAVGWTDVTERTTSSPNGSSRWAIPTRRPRRPSRSSTSNSDGTRTPSRGAKFERMPCSRGSAPVSIEEKQTTVRAGYAGSTARYSVPSRASRSSTGACACQSRSRLRPSTTITYTRRASGSPPGAAGARAG